MMITGEQFTEWKDHPVTREVYKAIKEAKEDLGGQLGQGVFLSLDSVDASALNHAKIVGQVHGLNQLLELDFDEIEPEE